MPECEQIQKARFFSTNPVDCEQGHDPVIQHRTNGRMTPPAEFTYNGHGVETVPPDTRHLTGNYWEIKIDGVDIDGQRRRKSLLADITSRFRQNEIRRSTGFALAQ
jgi:hypothetical protein